MKRKLYKNLRNRGRNIPPITYTQDMANFQNSLSSLGYVRSNINQNFTIDYGDGTSVTVALVANVNKGFNDAAIQHVFSNPFQAGVDKLITFTFEHPDNVVEIGFGYCGCKTNLPANLNYYKNLRVLRFWGTTGGSPNSIQRVIFFPFEILDLQYLEEVTFTQTFQMGSGFDNKIPDVLFNKPLTSLEYQEALGDNFADNNIALIYQLAGTLLNLGIGDNRASSTLTALPDDSAYGFQHLTSLTSFNSQNRNAFPTFPAVLNQIPTLVSINVGDSQFGSSGWGDLSNLVNLVTLTLTGSLLMPDSVPTWLIYTTKLKNFVMTNVYTTLSRIDNFIDSLYTFIDANTAKTGTSADQFRSMVINLTGVQATGVYQQPSGYSSGSSNGSPASQQEKIWILVNQYAHTVTRTQYNVTAITVGSSTQITLNVAPGANFRVGSVISFLGITGTVGAVLNSTDHTITNIAGSVVTVSTNTTGTAYTSGGNIYRNTY